MHVQPLHGDSDFDIISEVLADPTSEKITQLTQALLYENNRGLRSDLTHPALFNRVNVLEQLSSDALSPKRSNLLWCFHLATFGLSYAALKLYDYSKITKVLHQKKLLLKKYIEQIFISSPTDPDGMARIKKLLAPLDIPSKKEVLKEILIVAIKNKDRQLIKTCRDMLPYPLFDQLDKNIKMWKKAIESHSFVPLFNIQVIDELISNGEELDVLLKMEDGLKGTPLLIAARHQRSDLVNKLIEAGANVNMQDNRGMTPLMWAIKNRNEYLANDLIRAGADINIRDHKGNTALLRAVHKPQGSNVPQKAGISDMFIDMLLKNGADVNIANNKGDTALSKIIHQSTDKTKLPNHFASILAARPDLNLTNRYQDTPLQAAVFNDNRPMVEALLAAGANPEIQNNSGKRTALMSAIDSRRYSVIEPLIAAKQNLELQDYLGRTALFFASQDNNRAAARALIKAGADVNTSIYDSLQRRNQGVQSWVLAMKEEEDRATGLQPQAQPVKQHIVEPSAPLKSLLIDQELPYEPHMVEPSAPPLEPKEALSSEDEAVGPKTAQQIQSEPDSPRKTTQTSSEQPNGPGES